MRSILGRALAGYYALRRWLLTQAWFTSTLLPMLPRRARWALRRAFFWPADALERRTRDPSDPTPPKSQIFTGSVDDFAESGAHLVDSLVALGCLDRRSSVLDVGSGMGRLALALVRYRGDEGPYDGLEIVKAGVEWCDEAIASKHPGYRFTHADIHNDEYNPGGTVQASDYRFPYPDATFDLVVLVSVFTHMLPEDMEHYISEIGRVLVPGGHAFVTFSLLDTESLETMAAGRSQRRFEQVGRHWVVDKKVPELATAYEEAFVRELFAAHGQSCAVHYGSWSGRRTPPEDPPRFDQDVVVTTKR